MNLVIPPNTTLLRLVVNNPDKFHKQDWYINEEFANQDVSGRWEFNIDSTTIPAAVYAFMRVHQYGWASCGNRYVWTSDFDRNNDRVYVGGDIYRFQIHRHLTINPQKFVNSLDSK